MQKLSFDELQARFSNEENDYDEHKFLITSDGTVFISEEPFNKTDTVSRLKTLSHKDWFHELQGRREIDASETEETVTGGYAKNIGGSLEFWGESTTPIKGATGKDFNKFIEDGAIVTQIRRE